jgi:hypothetical protein
MKVKAAPTKKVGVLKIIQLKLRPESRGMSEIELALAKPIRVSKKFCFSDVRAPCWAKVTEVFRPRQCLGAWG